MRFAFALMVLLMVVPGCARSTGYPEAPVSGKAVEIPTGTLNEGAPVFFSHTFEGRKINFFVIKIKGSPASFFDACESCYPKKLGYRYEGGGVLCRACGMKYQVGEIGNGIGSCYPVKLPGSEAGGKYIVPLEALRNRAHMF